MTDGKSSQKFEFKKMKIFIMPARCRPATISSHNMATMRLVSPSLLSLITVSLIVLLTILLNNSPSLAMTTFSQLQSSAKSHLDQLPLEEQSTRHQIMQLIVLVGRLSASFLQHSPLDAPRPALHDLDESSSVVDWNAHPECCTLMGDLLYRLAVAAASCNLDLKTCILRKMELNARKYPIHLCKGKSGKYTKYSDQTGITKTEGQSTQVRPDTIVEETDQSIESVMAKITCFATDRHWSRFHTPRNLVLALTGELGELAELFQWRGDAVPNSTPEQVLSAEELDKVGQELADVCIYLLRLSHVCQVKVARYAMESAVRRRMELMSE
jgi:dCTP diphosphatase